jgi:hypothetical protein
VPHFTPSIDGESSVAPGTEVASGGTLDGSSQQDLARPPTHNWSSIGLGIVLAGGAYPLVVTVIYFVTGVAVVLWRQVSGVSDLPGIVDMFGVLVVLAVYLAVCSIAGVFWTSVVCLLTLPLVHLFALSLKLRINTTWLAAFSGGLVGFVAVLPVMLPMMLRMPASTDLLAVVAILALGPGVTTILGQLGGAWGARRDERLGAQRRRRQSLIASGKWLSPTDATAGTNQPGDSQSPRKFQFGIRHMLWIAVWLSLLLSVIRLSGIPFEFVLPLLVGWFVYQGATLWAGWRIGQRMVAQ